MKIAAELGRGTPDSILNWSSMVSWMGGVNGVEETDSAVIEEVRIAVAAAGLGGYLGSDDRDALVASGFLKS